MRSVFLMEEFSSVAEEWNFLDLSMSGCILHIKTCVCVCVRACVHASLVVFMIVLKNLGKLDSKPVKKVKVKHHPRELLYF